MSETQTYDNLKDQIWDVIKINEKFAEYGKLNYA